MGLLLLFGWFVGMRRGAATVRGEVAAAGLVIVEVQHREARV